MSSFFKKLILFIRYSISGGISFLLELGVLYILAFQLLLPYYFSVPIAFFLTTTVQFAIVHLWVFSRSRRKVEIEYEYFVLILLSGLVLATGLVAVFTALFNLDPVTARLTSGVFTGLWSFYLNARYNFRARLFTPR